MSDTGPPRAAIHDLGYKRYLGTRRPQSTRWQVIVRNFLSMSWRGWWQVKLWVAGAAMITVGTGVPMYLSRNEIFEEALGSGLPMTWADALIPMSFGFYPWVAFIVTLTAIAGVVARDLRAGAFEFYFSRPVRPVDYVLGKVGGAAILMSFFLLAGPLLLALFRVGLSRSTDELLRTLPIIPKTLLVGVVASLVFALLPLAFSSLAQKPRNTLAAWAAFFIVVGGTASGIALGTETPELAALDVRNAINGFAFGLFDVQFISFRAVPPMWACTTTLAVYSGLSIALLVWRLRRAQRAGLGGG